MSHGDCGTSTHCASSTPVFVSGYSGGNLTASERAKQLERKRKRALKRRQRRAVRNKAKSDIEANVPAAGRRKAKLRLYITALRLKLLQLGT